jgi:hypothetical protein
MFMGVAAEMDTRKIQGCGAFLQNSVIRIDKARKEAKNANERPRKKEAVMIDIPRKNAVIDVLPRTDRESDSVAV